ncbi:MAG: ABC transporter ATP-binding protein [Anaerolineae bacterium]|nr:MAG: ABC transporter ATP-binding protein [Anaerolineae bacterium]
MSPSEAITVTDLYKHFGDTKAVDGISFSVQQGEIFSLLGPNGAGKSTAISILSCLQQPNRGDASIMGRSVLQDPQAVKSFIGVVPQEIALYEDLSARENLSFWGKMYGLRGQLLRSRVDEVLILIGLTDRQKDRVGKFSSGMKRRLNIGIAFLHQPEVIIMDEPTVGIDPQSRRHILEGVKSMNEEGVTVLYTTHYMEEAQELSDHIAIMDFGKIIASGTHDELVKLVGEQDRIDIGLSSPEASVADKWGDLEGVSQVTINEDTVTVLAEDSNLTLPRLFEMAASAGLRINSVEIQEPNLETVFLHLTGRGLRD